MNDNEEYGIAIGTVTKFLVLPLRIQYKIAKSIGAPFNINLDETDMVMESFDYAVANGLIDKLNKETSKEFAEYKMKLSGINL